MAAFAKFNFPLQDFVMEMTSSANFETDESDPLWGKIRLLRDRFDALDAVWTTFSREELTEADYVALQFCVEKGYPQPWDNFKRVTYDMTEYCAACGSGLVQNRPYRMRGEPPWGSRSIMRVNWVPDEYFVKPATWEAVFKPFGVPCLPVLSRGGSKELETVVQLDLRARIELLMPQDVPKERCPLCGIVKYDYITRGNLPPPVGEPDEHMFKSSQVFGVDTHIAPRQVMVSNALYTAMTSHKVKGTDFAVCGPPTPWGPG